MFRKTIVVSVFLFVLVLANPAFARINVTPSNGQVKVVSADGVATLDSESPQATVSDATGGSADVAYDAETGEISAEALSDSPRILFGIAEIFLDEGESVDLKTTEGFKDMTITNTSTNSDVLIVFPDGSKVLMPKGAVISLVKLADNNYHLKVLVGEVEYTDSKGNKQTLTPDSPPILVQGFGLVPDWRETDIRRHPATP